MKYLILFFRLFLLLCIATPVLAKELACPDFPSFEPKYGPLAELNCYFHHQYENRIKQITASFGAPGGRPVIINLDGLNMILKYNGKTEVVQIADATYQNLKVFCHASLSVLMILSQQSPGRIEKTTLNHLQQLQTNLDAATKVIPTLNLPVQAKQATQTLAKITNEYLQKLITTQRWSYADLTSYYQKVMGSINIMIGTAPAVELNNLDKVLNPWLAAMSEKERKQIGIVIGVVHQARAQEHIIAYLNKRFSKQVGGDGATNENGLVVAEGIFDEQSALALLARHYLDRDIGRIVFNQIDRMQKDLMANPGKKWIDQHFSGSSQSSSKP